MSSKAPRLPIERRILLVFGITLMVVMGVSSIMPILPALARTFDMSMSAVGIVFMAFTLPGIILTPLGGVLADRIGRKKVLIPALLIFACGGAACAFATSLHQLLFFRFVQGVGAAPLGILYTTLIGDMYEGNERLQAMGYNAGILSLGTAIYPAVGGLLGEIGWRIPFLLPLLALPLAYAVARTPFPEPRSHQAMRDYLRSTMGIILSPRAITLFSLTLLTFLILYGPMVTYFPVLADQSFSAKPSTIGMVFSIASAGTVLTAVRLGTLSRIVAPGRLLLMSHVLYMCAMLLLPNMDSLWWTLLPIFLYGLAQGLNIPNTSTMITSLAPAEGRAAVMAVNGTILRLSQTVGPALFGLVYYLGGIPAVYAAGAILAGIMAVLVMTRGVAE